MQKYTVRHDKNDPKESLRSDGKLALGITIGALIVLLPIIGLESYKYGDEKPEILAIVPLIISLLVAAGSTYFASRALIEQRMTRQAGTDPVLIAHLGQRTDARELVTFNISNVGAGAAINIRVDVDRPENDLQKRQILTNIFKRHHPISVILQSKSIEFNFAMGWHLLGDTPLPPFQARLEYQDLAGGQYVSSFTIDVRELEGLGSQKSPQMRIVSALEEIQKKL
ncbi:hypothetical protein [Loktanella sp. R86503]|uniref:hypothetical protein n=1 Tax=Loktanella sp. R86503 TaxID=3093847 RepID=UPI0036D8257B